MLAAGGLENYFALLHLSLKRQQGDYYGERAGEAAGEFDCFHHAPARRATSRYQPAPIAMPRSATPDARAMLVSRHSQSLKRLSAAWDRRLEFLGGNSVAVREFPKVHFRLHVVSYARPGRPLPEGLLHTLQIEEAE